ncbi:MAG: InlB B-repeat-containing protein [Bacteroidales bacterium]
MKNRNLLFIFLFSLLILAFQQENAAQNFQREKNVKENKQKLTSRQKSAIKEQKRLEAEYNVKRGPRPPIDLKKVEPDAYEKGVVRIKLKPYMHEALDKRILKAGKSDYVKTGVESLDKINKAIGAKEYIRRLDNLYEVKRPGNVKKHKERHKAWGFHLLRDIKINSKTDVIEAVKKFNALDEVEYAEPVYKKKLIEPQKTENKIEKNDFDKTGKDNPKFTPNDPDYDNQYAFPLINAPEAWEITTGNPDIIVAIVDQGVQYDHPDLEANMWEEIGPDGTGTDGDYHGTHVGGTVAAVTNNGEGVAGCAGGDGTDNTGVKLMSCDIFNGSVGDEAAQVYAADNGAMISQNSWGYQSADYYNQTALDGIDYFNENGGGDALEGGLTIFAAGNDDDDGKWYPAYYGYEDEDVLGAMAVASTNENDIKSDFSNYGEWIDISAPGSNIYSTGDYEGSWDPEYIPDSYTYMNGTSMACPHVSGIASAIVSITEGLLTNEELWQLLTNNVEDIYPDNPDYEGQLGAGRINFLQAAEEGEELAGGVPVPENFIAEATGETSINISWNLNENNDDVMLAWNYEGNDFGEPVDGENYNEGDELPGGGTVIYSGSAESFSHNDLTASTIYTYRLFSIAGEATEDYNAGDYSRPKSTTTNTDCGTYSLPFNENFSDGVPPLCWTSVDNDSDGQEWITGGNDYEPVSGDFVAVSASWANDEAVTPDNWLVSPEIQVNSDLVEISYWIKAQDQDWPEETYSILVSDDGNSVPGNFTEVHKETLNANNAEWTEKKVYIENYSGSTIHIAFRHWDCTDQFQIVLDDINIEELDENTPIPVSDPSPSNNQTDISTDGELTWTWGANTETYDLWLGKAGDMTKVVEGADAGNEGTQGAYEYSGLDNINDYEWKVVSYNSDNVENESPLWSFTTTCGIVTSFPYTQDFSDGELPMCWENIDNTGEDQVWEFNNPGERDINTTTGDNGFAILDSDNYGSGSSQDADLISPPFDFTDMDSINLSFEHYYNDYDSEVATLSYSTDNGSTWDEIETWSGADTENAETFSQDISNEVAGESGVKFKWNYTGSWGYYWAVDDIEIDGEILVTYTATFNVTDTNSDAIEGAEININNNTLVTDADGEASIDLPDGTYNYSVIADGYETIEGSTEVSGEDITESIEMTEAYSVAFNVTDGTNPIEEATVEIEGHGNEKTDADGFVQFPEITNGTYNYNISADGYYDANGSLEVNNENIEETVELLAIPTYMVSLNAEPENAGELQGEGEYEENEEITISAVPNEEHEFINWTDEAEQIISEEPEFSYTVTNEDVTFTANFEEIPTYSLTLIAEPEEGGEVQGSGEYQEDEEVMITATPNEGYEFVNWTDEDDEIVSEETEFNYKTSNEDMTFTANFEEIPTYSLTLVAEPEEGGEVQGSGEYQEDEEVMITATPNEGYEFVNWTDEDDEIVSEEAEFNYRTTNENTTFTANFVNIYEVTFDIESGNGILEATANGEQINSSVELTAGTELVFTATPDDEWQVDEWLINEEPADTEDEIYTIDSLADNMDIKVVFEEIPTYILSLDADPEEGGEVNGDGEYKEGDEITVTANTNEEYEFVNWTDENQEELSDENEFIFTMPNENITLTANFENLATSINSDMSENTDIYPNPTNGKFYIEVNEPGGFIKVHSLTGKRIIEKQIDDKRSLIDISDQPAGIYLIEVFNNSENYTKKLIKK